MKAYEVIRGKMEANGIKQVFVAEKAQVPPALFQRSLDGKRKLPADEFIRICRVLNMDLSDFGDQSAGEG